MRYIHQRYHRMMMAKTPTVQRPVSDAYRLRNWDGVYTRTLTCVNNYGRRMGAAVFGRISAKGDF